MSTDDVVDITRIPANQHHRQVWLRVGIPIVGVALVLAAVLAIALYSERANRSGVLQLSDSLLTTLEQRISQQVTAYLEPATRAARLARDLVAQRRIADPGAALAAYAASALRQIPQIDALYIGDGAGNFMMVQRGANGGTATKIVQNAPGPRLVEWAHHDAEGHLLRREQDPTDNYDPRTREWFQGALKSDDVFWTGVYVFFTQRTPGVTGAIRYHGDDGIDHVFGVDITLQALSDFLASLKIGRTGRAVIIDATGHLIAAPDSSRMLREVNGELMTARIDELNDPVLAAAYDHFRVEGYGQRIITVQDKPFVSIASRLPGDGRDWSLLMIVPQKDFIGFVASNGRKTLWLSLVVVALAAVLAVLLVRQGLRADRAGRLLVERARAIELQNQAFADLARQPDLFDRAEQTPLRAMTQAMAELANAQRASVWHLLDGGRQLRCEDIYDHGSGRHTTGQNLARVELPVFFTTMEAGETIEATDATSDARTVELYRTWLHASHRHAVYATPVRSGDATIGVIMLEDASNIADARAFIPLVANLLAIRMRRASDTQAALPDAATGMMQTAVGERSLTAELVSRELQGSPGIDVFASAVVMAIKFVDAAAIATKDISGETTLADRIAIMLQDVAAAHDIPYMKLAGHDLIAAAGFTSGDTSAVVRIADAAIAIRDHCLEQFEACGQVPRFRIGIDCGLAIGSHVGQQPRLFNLWGEAVRTAHQMADTSAGPGTIQVSEAVYQRLRQQFVFRLRGRFYLPHAGVEQTFVLGGRQ